MEDNSSPIIIINDNGVRVYVELKKIFTRFANYLLCISTFDKSNQKLEFDHETGVVLCVEGMESDALKLSVVESQNQYSSCIPEFEVKSIITDYKNTKIKVDQFYRDKATLVVVIEKYTIANRFNNKAKLSDKGMKWEC